MLYWFLKSVMIGPIARVLFRLWSRGVENIPAEGPAILASNHLSFSDSVFLPLVVSRRIVFLAKADYFTGRGFKGRMTAGFMRGVGMVPVDRGGGRASEAALQTGIRVLEEGDLFGIYPEGTRSLDGRLYRGKTGVARLAVESGAPVIPVVMVGTDKAQPIGQRLPRLHRVGVIIGEPLDFSRYAGMEHDRFVLRTVTDEIMLALMRLSGQAYADIYAATMKARVASGTGPQAEAELRARGVTAPGGLPKPEAGGPTVPESDGAAPVG